MEQLNKYYEIVQKSKYAIFRICDGWKFKGIITKNTIPNNVFDIFGQDFNSINLINREYKKITYRMVCDFIKVLNSEYKQEVEYINIFKENGFIQILPDHELVQFISKRDKDIIFAYIKNEKNIKTLVVLKEFAFYDYLGNSILSKIKESCDYDKVIYVDIIDSNESAEIKTDTFNQNRVVYSFNDYITNTFGIDEFNLIKNEINNFKNDISNYLGIITIRSLRPNSISNYKNIAIQIMKKHNYELDVFDKNLNKYVLSHNKHEYLKEKFLNNKYLLLFDNYDFSKSFVTAEWMNYALRNSGQIDLVPIIMGYLKSLEQFLFDYIYNHNINKNGEIREIFRYHDRKKDIDIYTHATKQYLDKNKKYITLGPLLKFLVYEKNRDLININILDDDFILYLNTLIDLINEDRNLYFHKKNEYDWKQLEEIRKRIYEIYYIVLGGFSCNILINNPIDNLNNNDKQNYYLCEYINNRSSYNESLNRPVFFINGNRKNPYTAQRDFNIKYDDNGFANYSGIYLYDKNSKQYITYNISNLPEKIEQGMIVIDENICHIDNKIISIYENGKFLLNRESFV